jgi:HNH endonuclease
LARFGPAPRPLAERFWAQVLPEPNSGCWVWTGATHRGGYGAFSRRRSVSVSAHRMAWVLHHGAIPDGLDVLHRCDVPACVNPAHLWLGTHDDNMRDCATKGRLGIQRDPARYAARLVEWRAGQAPGTSARSRRRHRARERVAGEAVG